MSYYGIKWEMGACVLSLYDDDGYLLVQPDGLGAQPRIDAFLAHHPLGFAACPQDPDTDPTGKLIEGQAANCLIGTDGNESHVIPLEDARGVSAFPQLKKGGAAQYAVPKQKHNDARLRSFDVHDGDNGTKTVYVEFVDAGTLKAHLITAGVDANGKPVLEVVHGNGQGVVMVDDYITMRNKNGTRYVQVDDDSVSINGDTKINGSVAAGNDVKTGTAVSLNLHTHLTAMGPSGAAIPTP